MGKDGAAGLNRPVTDFSWRGSGGARTQLHVVGRSGRSYYDSSRTVEVDYEGSGTLYHPRLSILCSYSNYFMLTLLRTTFCFMFQVESKNFI